MRAARNVPLTLAQVLALLAGSVFFAGCSVMENVKSAATEMTTSAPAVGPYDPPQQSAWESQVQPAVAAPPASPTTQPQSAQPHPVVAAAAPVAASPTPSPAKKAERLPEPSYTPAQTVQPVVAAPKPSPAPQKGAEKLMTINAGSAIPVHARELSPADQKSANTEATETSMVASAGGGLIFKGPPRAARAGGAGIGRWILLSVFVGLMLAGAVFAFLQFQRKGALAAAAPPRKEKPPEGLEMKEPAGHAPDTVLDA